MKQRSHSVTRILLAAVLGLCPLGSASLYGPGAVLGALALALVEAQPARADTVPPRINHQGLLKDTDGNPIAGPRVGWKPPLSQSVSLPPQTIT